MSDRQHEPELAISAAQAQVKYLAGELEAMERHLRQIRSALPTEDDAVAQAIEEGQRPPTVAWVLRGALDCALGEDLKKLIATLLDAAQVTQKMLDEEWRRKASPPGGSGDS